MVNHSFRLQQPLETIELEQSILHLRRSPDRTREEEIDPVVAPDPSQGDTERKSRALAGTDTDRLDGHVIGQVAHEFAASSGVELVGPPRHQRRGVDVKLENPTKPMDE